ncbi:zinc ribbon domain-containing protein [Novipirellula maiorica]|nr:zinc ribbon domain-containing protein [Rhodopirellula maiorica]
MSQCPSCNQEIATDASACPACGATLQPSSPQPSPYASPTMTPPAPVYATEVSEGDGTGGVIPYKNPKALIAYYLGILSGLPLIGFPIGIAAFVLGIQGLQARKRNPVIKGSVHAGIGIGCGAIFTILWGLVIVLIVFALLAGK